MSEANATKEYDFFSYNQVNQDNHQSTGGEAVSSSQSSTTAPIEQRRIKYLFSDVGR